MTLTQLGAAGILALLASSAMAEEITGDAAKGEKVFRKCKACHAVGEDAKNKVGPILNGIVGRAAASEADFAYSPAFEQAAADGLVWTVDQLAAFLEKPKDVVDGTKMSFAGLRKEQDRADIIAYLATFN
ncbi:cytochrome c family protein [Roseovarius sp. CAU 1744]|uniref:c-type cytochrome n=1 Tax=Roseovarius sp. CAU 1744 TaxID=3140368 RepID=UPI00325AAA73